MGFFEWLGLVSDDKRYDYDDENLQEDTEEFHVDEEYEPSVVTPIDEKRRHRNGEQEVRQPARSDLDRIITVHPRTYNEARTIGEHYKDGVPVIMNLSDMEHDDAKRLIDFASGLVFGLNGTIERVTSKVFLLSPKNVAVAAEDKERIASGGFFNQS